MTESSRQPRPYFIRLQRRIDIDEEYRSTFMADPLGMIASEGVSTEGLRLAGSNDFAGADDVTGHAIRIGHYLCFCVLHDANGVCVVEQCLIP